MGDVSLSSSDTAAIMCHTMAGAALLRVAGDIDVNVAAALRAALDAALERYDWIIMDAARVGVVDSVGLHVLVTASLTTRGRGGDLLIAAPSRLLLSVLHLMRPATSFSLFDTVPQAMTKAQGRRRSEALTACPASSADPGGCSRGARS